MNVAPGLIRAEPHTEVGFLIQRDTALLIDRWSRRAVQEQPNARRVHHQALLDHMHDLLQALGRSLAESGDGAASQHCLPATGHGEQRWETGRLADDLLDISRIAQGKIEVRKEPVELAAVLNQAVQTSMPHLQARHHQLEVAAPAEPVWLEADPARLVQVLVNLLNNAARYSEPGGHVWLSAEREGEGTAVLRVRDDGMGIPPEKLLHVAVRLPILAAPPASREEPARDGDEQALSPPPAPSHRRILVVDDNVDAATSLNMLLALNGHEVRVAHGGATALRVAEDFQPEVVLLSMHTSCHLRANLRAGASDSRPSAVPGLVFVRRRPAARPPGGRCIRAARAKLSCRPGRDTGHDVLPMVRVCSESRRAGGVSPCSLRQTGG